MVDFWPWRVFQSTVPEVLAYEQYVHIVREYTYLSSTFKQFLAFPSILPEKLKLSKDCFAEYLLRYWYTLWNWWLLNTLESIVIVNLSVDWSILKLTLNRYPLSIHTTWLCCHLFQCILWTETLNLWKELQKLQRLPFCSIIFHILSRES